MAAIKTQLDVFLQIAGTITDAPIKQELVAAVEKTSATLIVEVDAARAKFDAWFNSAQDRAQQWFQIHARGLTIAASVLIAFLFQLDAVEVFHHVSVNAPARNALVAASGAIVQQADGVLSEKGGLVQRIADDWNKAEPGHALANIGAVQNTGQLESQLRKIATQGANPMTENDFAARYKQVTGTAIKAYYDEKQQLLDQLGKKASATGFEFIPAGFWRWETQLPAQPRCSPCWYYFWSYWRHSLGMLLFTALLTLGAPYWYNILKNLTSLRPALSQLIGKEETGQTPAKK